MERLDLVAGLDPAAQNPPSDATTPPTPSSKLRAPGVLELEELLATRLDTKVQVAMGSKRGRVSIDFANLEDLERIARIIIGG
jgi:ParB family chromosome partitioning protein